jgi:hypothetical protein
MKSFIYFFIGLGRFFAKAFKELIDDMVEEGKRKSE